MDIILFLVSNRQILYLIFFNIFHHIKNYANSKLQNNNVFKNNDSGIDYFNNIPLELTKK